MNMMQKYDAQELESSIIQLNKLAISHLQESSYTLAHDFLTTAKKSLKPKPNTDQICRLKAITYNNFGCLYKRQAQFPKALAYLMQALSYETRLQSNSPTIAGTYLNISSIYSDLQNPQKSLNFALQAISSIESNFKPTASSTSSLVVAYQAAGNQYNKLGKLNEAKVFLSQGYEFALKYFGINHPLTLSIDKSFKSLSQREKDNPAIERMINYFDKRDEGRKKIKEQSWNKGVRRLGERKGVNRGGLRPIEGRQERMSRKNLETNASEKTVKGYIKPEVKNQSQSVKVSSKIARVHERLVVFNKNLSMFGKNVNASMKGDFKTPTKGRKEEITKKKPRRTKKHMINCAIVIQKHVRGWLVRKKLKLSPQNFIQIKPNPSKPIQSSLAPFQRLRPRLSFLEKVLLIQRQIRLFLSKLHAANNNLYI